MGIITWILCGIVVGMAAKPVMPGPSAGGIAVSIPLCIFGALLGGLLPLTLGVGSVTDFGFRSLLLAFSGSLVMMLALRSCALRLAPEV